MKDVNLGGSHRAAKMWTNIRWLAVIPIGVVVWIFTMGVGVISTLFLEDFCPPELIVSGSCEAVWYQPVHDALMVMFSGLAAIGVVLSTALVAPSNSRYVAIVAFAIGACFATYFIAMDPSDFWMLWIASLASGLAALRYVLRGFSVDTASDPQPSNIDR